MERLRIKARGMEFYANLSGENPLTEKKIVQSLPVEGEALRWGEEIYFHTELEIGEENSRTEVEEGDVAFWCAGKGIAIFFGKTPASTGEKPVAASAVNVFARLEKVEKKKLSSVKSGEKIVIEKA